MQTPVLFVNIGWMNFYDGPREDDRTRGNHKFLKTHKHGYECYNFQPKGKYVYGQITSARSIHLERLGADKKDEKLNGVLVIWMAKNPENNFTYIIGWHKDATVFRYPQTDFSKERKLAKDFDYEHTTMCIKSNAHLVDVAERSFIVPSAQREKGGFGQSPLWYAEQRQDIVKEALSYIKDGTLPKRLNKKGNKRSGGWQFDIEKRKKIESTAIDTAIRHYENNGYEIKSVESEAKGWDLEAKNSFEELHIEVKGTALATISVEFTPNEYDKIKNENKGYVIFIVTDCLSDNPRKFIYRYSKIERAWINQLGTALTLTEKTGAVGTSSIDRNS